MKRLIVTLCAIVMTASSISAQRYTSRIEILKGEKWWGINLSAQFSEEPAGAMMLVSSVGRYIWSASAMTVQFDEQYITIGSETEQVTPVKAGKTLREAYLICFHKNIRSVDRAPNADLYTKPIYDLRIDARTSHSADFVCDVADRIIAAKLPTGTIVIPGGWQSNMTTGRFNSDLYPSPQAMVNELHSKGFRVLLSLAPTVPAVGRIFTDLRWNGMLLKDRAGMPVIISQPAGYFALIDLSNPDFAVAAWFDGYRKLRTEVGFDGYLLNCEEVVGLWGERQELFLTRWNALGDRVGGDVYEAQLTDVEYPPMGGAMINMAYQLIIKEQLMKPLSIIPPIEMLSWQNNTQIWSGIVAAMRFKTMTADYVKELLAESASTGEPLVRPMEYQFPGDGFADCTTQFMLGSRYMIVPITDRSGKVTVRFPKGNWEDAAGKLTKGPRVLNLDINESTILYWELSK